jgi:X-Pro dipeptidyl-peptidase
MRTTRAFAAAAFAVLTLVPITTSAPASAATGVVIRDGQTQPVYSYADAVREKIFVETPVDSDADGKLDRVALFVTRPKETNQGLKVASIVEGSPYFGGLLDPPYHPAEVTDVPRLAPWSPPTGPWPGVNYGRVYYDNFFVSRGYAVIAANTLGTGESDGCPTAIGTNEKLGMKAVIEWLTGHAKAFDAGGAPVQASWSTGNVAMAGKSYDGTLPLAVAGTGVAGLKTIVSISGVSNWYDYYRANGAVVAPDGFVGEDADLHAKVVLTRKDPAVCEPVMRDLERRMDRVSGDYNAFWDERNFVKDVGRFRASVFQVAGINDWNVKPLEFGELWQALDRHNVPRKLWLHQGQHDDPLLVRQQAWLDAVHKWFDHELYNVHNGIDREPRVQVETAPGTWKDYRNWPDPAAHNVTLRFGPGAAAAQPGSLSWWPTGFGRSQGFVDAPSRTADELVAGLDSADPNRLLYLTGALPRDVRLSGTPSVMVRASVDGPSPYLSALLVDYGTDNRVVALKPTADTWCFGDSIPGDSGCRNVYQYTFAESPYQVVSRGWIDVRNRHSASVTEPLRPGQDYTFRWSMQPREYTFKAGHRLGVLLLVTDQNYTLRYPAGTKINTALGVSGIQLPLVG